MLGMISTLLVVIAFANNLKSILYVRVSGIRQHGFK